MALDLGQLLRAAGHEVDFYYFDQKEGAEDPGRAFVLDWKRPRHWQRYDLVHTHGLRPDLYAGWYAHRMPPVVSTMHNYLREDLGRQYGPVKTRLAEALWKRASRRHCRTVVLSQHMAAYYRRFWPHQRFQVIPNTRQLQMSAEAPKRQARLKAWAGEAPLLLSLSTASPLKNLSCLLDFLQQKPDWRYVHIGGGDVESLQRKAQARGVADRCRWLGPQARGWEYLPAASVFALPSRSEGFPLSLLEAVCLEVPALTSDLPVFRELFTETEVARFKLDHPADLVKTVEAVYQNGAERARRARRRYDAAYAPAQICAQYENCYRECL
jgi:glycosyltransferase involved in cell wall biosynthesis